MSGPMCAVVPMKPEVTKLAKHSVEDIELKVAALLCTQISFEHVFDVGTLWTPIFGL